MQPTKQSAAVLAGGGVFGAYEVGVLLALSRGESPGTDFEAFAPKILSGTSVGAYNATYLASRADQSFAAATEALARSWRQIIANQAPGIDNGVFRYRLDPRDYLNLWTVGNRPVQAVRRWVQDTRILVSEAAGLGGLQLTRVDIPWYQRVAAAFSFSAIISTRPMLRTIRRTIDFEKVRRSRQGLRIVATDWKSGTPLRFANRDLSDELGPKLVRGSASIPGIFPSQRVGPWQLVDGGVVMNDPLIPAVQAGANELHLIRPFPMPRSIPMDLVFSTLAAVGRSQLTAWASTLDSTVRHIGMTNQQLAAVHHAGELLVEKGLPAPRARGVTDSLKESLGLKGLRQVRVHNYHPSQPLVPLDISALELLNFSPKRIEQFLALGYQDAVEHDCQQNQCAVMRP